MKPLVTKIAHAYADLLVREERARFEAIVRDASTVGRNTERLKEEILAAHHRLCSLADEALQAARESNHPEEVA